MEDWNWFAEGRAAEDAAWETLLHMEVGQMHSDVATVTIMDLVNAFERVSLEAVWRWELYLGFPKRLLHLVITYFGIVGRVVVGGCVSKHLSTITAIVAGSRFSVFYLWMVLTMPMRKLLKPLAAGQPQGIRGRPSLAGAW